MPIEHIRIHGVRGIRRELTLELGGSSLVLRGDNGTGKSSIVAGLQWALRGEHSPVPAARADSEEAYRAHVLEDPAAAKVTVVLTGNRGTISVTPEGLQVQGAGQQLREGCIRSSPFLLRKQLLRFLEDKPVDRFKYLEAFLDLGEADNTREAIGERHRSHEAAGEQHRRTRDSLLQPIVALLPRELAPNAPSWSTVVSALVAWSKQLAMPVDGPTWEDLVALVAKLTPLLQGENLARKRIMLQGAITGWNDVGVAPVDPEPLLQAEAALMTNGRDAELSVLLDEALKHFSRHADATTCPVCTQGVETKRLAASLDARLGSLRELRAAQKAVRDCGTAWHAFCTKAGMAAQSIRVRLARDEIS